MTEPIVRRTVVAPILERRDFCFDDALEMCRPVIEPVLWMCEAVTRARDSWTARSRYPSPRPGAHEKID